MSDHVVLNAPPRPEAAQAPDGTRVVAATSLPMFAAAAQQPDGDGADGSGIRGLVRDAGTLTLRGTAVHGGAPGSLINGLALLGGPDYGRTERGDALTGRQVVIDLDGAPPDVARGTRHLERMALSLGADDVRNEPGRAAVTWSGSGVSAPGAPVVDAALGQIVLPGHQHLEEAHAWGPGGAAHYCPPEGHPRLRAALRDRTGGHPAGPDRAVTVTAGASMALTSVLAALVPAGGTVMVPDPGYPAYTPLLRRLGLRALPYPVPGIGEGLSPTALSRASEADAVLWNSPSNPTGWVADSADLELLAACAREHDLLVISDEVYNDLVWEPGTEPGGPCGAGIADRTVVVDSVSKRHAAAGLRVGWAHGPSASISAVTSAHWAMAMSPPTLSQLAAANLLTRNGEIVARVRESLGGVLDRLPEGIPRPPAGPYLWLPAPPSGVSAAKRIEEQMSLRVMPGEVFGERGAGRVRINLGAIAASGERAERALHRVLLALRDEPTTYGAEE